MTIHNPPYVPLAHPDRNIRLITILPAQNGDINDPVECTMREVCLENPKPNFHALSYTWGDPNITVPITLNGVSINVTTNLNSALRQLRAHYEVEIWIDAISINQVDLNEKEKQIPLMGTIYSAASHVVVWLGPKDDDTDLAIEHIRDWYAALEKHRISEGEYEDMFDMFAVVDELHDPFDEDKFAAVNSLFRRPWWSRKWVIQEIFMAKDVTLLVGMHILPWEHVSTVLSCWDHDDLKSSGAAPINFFRIRGDEIQAFDQLEGLRHLKNKGGLTQDFLEVAKFHHSSLCGDPRDRIYALMSLSSDGPDLIVPNYSKPPAEVFTDFAITHIQHYNHLGILENAGLAAQDEPLRTAGVPSWVAVWGPECYRSTNFHCKDAASGTSKPIVSFPSDTRTLEVSGYAFDKISQTSLFHGYTPHTWEPIVYPYDGDTVLYPTGITRLHAFFRLILYSIPLSWLGDPFIRARAVGFIIWLSITSDGPGPWDLAGESGFETPVEYHVKTWLRGSLGGQAHFTVWLMSRGESPWDEDNDDSLVLFRKYLLGDGFDWQPDKNFDHDVHLGNFAREMTGCTRGMALMNTERGYLGLVPAEAEEGDLICVLLGCPVPLVLRKVGDGYVVIGSCVVQGIMNGEFMEEVEKGGWELEKFLLR